MVEGLITSSSVDEVIEGHASKNSLSERRCRIERIGFLNIFHLVMELFILSDNGQSSIHSCLYLDDAQTEHSHASVRVSSESLRALERLSDVFEHVDAFLFEVKRNVSNVISYTK